MKESEKGVEGTDPLDLPYPEPPRSLSYASDEVLSLGRPRGWMYKAPRIGGLRLPWYASPPTQLVLVALVCFLCPGMFNALSGLGGAGFSNPNDNNNAITALYSTFAVVGFFAGTFANRLGIRLTLGIGGMGYCVYAGALLCYKEKQNAVFLIFSGAFLGICAGLLWCAQGAIMMAYPPEHSKGKYISWFWMIFNLGAVLGSLIPLAANINSTTNSVNAGTYIGFIALMVAGAILAFFLVDSKLVQRSDGSHVILMKHPTWHSEIFGLWEVLRSDPYIIALFPMFFCSNWFYTYQFNDVNLAKHDSRTRALNNFVYWCCQIIGAFVFGYALDMQRVRRSIRARVALVVLLLLTGGVWAGGYLFQRQYTRLDAKTDGFVKLDYEHGHSWGSMCLMMAYGFYDAAWQTCVYWFMGALTNNGRKTAHFAGFYKGIQSAGAAVIYRLDTLGTPYMALFFSCWFLLGGSLIVAAPVIVWKVKDSVNLEDDLVFTDMNEIDVVGNGVVGGAMEKRVDGVYD